jgi:hypothetical protein
MDRFIVDYQIYANGPLFLYILISTINGESINNVLLKYYQDLGLCLFLIKLYHPFILQLNHQHTYLLEYS